MNDRTIREAIKDCKCNHLEDDCDTCYGNDICKEDVDRCLTAILARVKSEVVNLKVDIHPEITEWITHKTREEAESHNRAIDQVLKVLEGELTNGK